MAETKAKKQPPKISDITKPGKSAPSSSARPLIITHRPVLQDPMMVQDGAVSDDDNGKVTNSQPVSHMSHNITLQPSHAAEKDSATPGAPAVSGDIGKGKTIAVLAEEAAKRKGEDTSADESDNDKASKQDAEKVEVKKTKSDAEAELPEPAADEAEEATDKAAELTSEDISEEKTEEKSDEKPEESSKSSLDEAPSALAEAVEDKPVEKEAEAPEKDAPEEAPLPLGEDVASPSTGNEPGDTNLSEAAQREANAAKKLAEEQEKIIMSGKYYLPINAVAHRRTKRHIVLGLALILLLAAVLFLAGWDANFFSIPGYTAPTNYL